MASGGIYDQIGGGFHRYSVDAKWLVPHFEKMLYDNAFLAKIYSMAHGIYSDTWTKFISDDILDYLILEMSGKSEGFYAAEDADMTMKLWKFLKPKLSQNNLMRVYINIERPLARTLIEMEKEGVAIDKNKLKRLLLRK